MKIETITICGGGNAAHAIVSIIRNNFSGKINLFLPYGNEATYFKKLIDEKRFLTATIIDKKIYGRPDKVSKFAKDTCREADLILMPLPAFAHEPTLLQIAPFLKEEAIIGAIPARSGFEYAALKILKDNKKEKVKIFGMQTLPWACRIKEYASKVDILGKKRSVGMAAFPYKITSELASFLTQLLDLKIEPLPNMLTLSLANVGQIIHPGIMYGLFKGKKELKYRKEEIPLFYQGVTKEISQTLKTMSDEILLLTKEIKNMDKSIDLDQVLGLKDWLIYSYKDSIADKSTLQSCFVTNSAYKGLRAPMKKINNDYFLPDFQARYLTEDVPYGLVVTKSIAQLAKVDIPIIDEVILTISKWIGKEYIRGGYLEGKDIKDTRIPQNYGINNLEEIIVF
ncbi:MAG: NAD/NADP octopine/nopaline dehydrogenase family protein [Candidatus Caldatribacteriota bacterium]|nr:NAD/NADP octopine/nopaline dehydrogenase family protein [Candidatus Caldatribacteriota bacterium]